jgi:iron complex outermembrane receptor protein
MIKKGLFGASAIALAATGVLAPTANAQEGVLEEIIVTAQKREQNIQDVPISISTLSGDILRMFESGGEDIRMLSARIPGLNAESSNGRIAPRFYIRGLGNTDFDLAASQPVSIIMDEVVMENVVLKSFPLFDLDRVEVLRGPQGSLFGRNTPAGIIKFESRKPSQEADGYLQASGGTLGSASFRGAFGGPMSDYLSVRAAGMYLHRSDYIDNDFTGEDDALGHFNEYAGRIQVLYESGGPFDALLNVHGRSIKGTAAIFRANILGPGNNNLNANYDRETVFFNEGDNNPQAYDIFGGSLKMNYDAAGYTITSISAFEHADGSSLGDIDGGNPAGPGFIPFQSVTEDGIDDLDQFTQEIRIASNTDGPLNWQAGFYYFDSKLVITTSPFFAPPSTVRHDNETWAIFGQASYDMSQQTTLTGGIRYTDDKKTLDGAGPFGTPFAEAVDGERVSWDVAINHAANEYVSVYGRVASGFRAPTIQGRDIAFFGAPSVATEEKILSFEAGFKAILVDQRMRLNASAFYYTVDDIQLSAVGGTGNFIELINANKATGWGFEGDLEFLASDNLTITAGFSYNNTEIKDSDLLLGFCALCTVTDPLVLDAGGTLRAVVDGNPLPQAPKITANLTIDYRMPMGNDGEFFFFTDWSITGKFNLFLYESEEFNTSGNFEGGFRAGYAFKDGAYEIAAFGRNITNESNVKGGIDFNNNTAYVNEPRVWGVEVSARF